MEERWTTKDAAIVSEFHDVLCPKAFFNQTKTIVAMVGQGYECSCHWIVSLKIATMDNCYVIYILTQFKNMWK